VPRVKRYFRCSQLINTDPEIRALKHDCGLTGFSIWLEILARTDGTPDGLWKVSERDIGGVLGGVCESNTRGSARCLQWVTDRGWITWQRGSEYPNRWGLIVVNHRIWQGLEGEKQIPEKKVIISPPSVLPSVPSLKDTISVSDFAESWNEQFKDQLPCVALPMNGSRNRKVSARLKEHQSLEFWQQVFTNIKSSKFLLGLSNGSWRATLDWIVANDTNCVKVYEGTYADKRG